MTDLPTNHNSSHHLRRGCDVSSPLTFTSLCCCCWYLCDTTTTHQVARCLTFLRQSKGAALAFYSRLRDHVSLPTVVKLAAMLLRCVFTAALKDKVGR